jgi:hypothetical protein
MTKDVKGYETLIIRYPIHIMGIPTSRIFITITTLVFLYFLFTKIDFSSTLAVQGNSGKTIFVAISSFRDPYCMKTLQTIYSRAHHPENVYVGIVQQNADMDADCITVGNLDEKQNLRDLEILLTYKTHIRIIRMNDKEAQGPVYARAMTIEKLYQNEDFIFQIDSHSIFDYGWDTILIHDMERLPPKSIISHYPLDWDSNNGSIPQESTLHIQIMCKGFWNSDGILQPQGALFGIKDTKNIPHEGAFIGAGMFFYTREAAKEVPIDPYLKHLFHGEESSLTFRYVAKGYKFYSPSRNVIYHFYYRKNYPKFWDKRSEEYDKNQKNSLQRVKYMMDKNKIENIENPSVVLAEIEKYGIHWNDPQVQANMERYFRKFEIDMEKKQMKDLCSKDGMFPAW